MALSSNNIDGQAESEGGDMIQGPVTGGRHGWAFNKPLIDLSDKG